MRGVWRLARGALRCWVGQLKQVVLGAVLHLAGSLKRSALIEH